MDAVKCRKSGKIHAAPSGTDETLCMIKNLDRKIRTENRLGLTLWTEITLGKPAKHILTVITCGFCKKVLQGQLDYRW